MPTPLIPSKTMTYTTPSQLWMCRDSSRPESKIAVDEYLPLAAIAELVATICSIPLEKAEACVDAICGQSNLIQAETAWSQLRVTSSLKLQRTGGLTQRQAAKLQAAVELGRRAYTVSPAMPRAIESPDAVYQLFADKLAYQPVEYFAAAGLDIKHRPLAVKVIAQGSETETIAHPRTIFRWALSIGATRLIVAHNHPSNCLESSPEDLSLTGELIQGGKNLGIPILDHIIMGKGTFNSIRQAHPEYWA